MDQIIWYSMYATQRLDVYVNGTDAGVNAYLVSRARPIRTERRLVAVSEGPVIITRNGKAAAVLLGPKDNDWSG